MPNALLTIKALNIEITIAEHLGDLAILLTKLLKDELTLVAVSLVLSTPPIFPSLSCQP